MNKKELAEWLKIHYPEVKPYVWEMKPKKMLEDIYNTTMERLTKGVKYEKQIPNK